MIFEQQLVRMIQKFTMDVNPTYKLKERFRGGIQSYMMDGEAFFSHVSSRLKNINNFQKISFGSSILLNAYEINKIT